MRLVTKDARISRDELAKMSTAMFGDLVKAVVDVNKRIMAVDAELHADEEAFLLDLGSRQADLWGINLYTEIEGEDWLEFDSMINVRPVQNNRSRGVEDLDTQALIRKIVKELVD